MFVDYIENGQGFGEVGAALEKCRFDIALMRPYRGEDGRGYVDYNTGKTVYNKKTEENEPVYERELITNMVNAGRMNPVTNATTLLRKDEWKMLDRAVLKAARLRLTAWNDLASRNSFGGFNGMAKMILEHETMSDPGEALVDMDGLTEGRSDKPLFQNEGLPLPITHSSFNVSARKLANSRNSGTPLDTTMAEANGRRVAEMIEQTLIGVKTGVTFGVTADYGNTPTVYGYTNHPDINTKVDMTAPSGTNGTTILTEWLAARELLYDAKFFGPYMVYVSDNYDQFLDNEFKTESGISLRTRLLQIPNVIDIKRLDFLTTNDAVLFVQMTSDVARAVNGMGMTTIQWDAHGGMQTMFKVMAIMVPQIRADFDGNSGICYATTS